MFGWVIPAGPLGRDGDRERRVGALPVWPAARRFRGLGIVALPLALAACEHRDMHAPGTPEHSAAVISRGYDCGLRVERGRVVAAYAGDERRRLVSAGQSYAVRSYNAPRMCGEAERAEIARALRSIARR